jgi:toxin ParE1/3/4
MGAGHRRVVWTEAASTALDEAIAYVAKDSPVNARALLERVLSAAQSLSDLSERGAPVPEINHPDIRQLLPEPYRLIYQVEGERVTILTVLHQRSDVALWSRRQGR